MKIPYYFLDEDHFPSDEPCWFQDNPWEEKYIIICAQTIKSIDGFSIIREGAFIEDAKHNLWQAFWAIFAKLPERPEIPIPSEEMWKPSEYKDNFIDFEP